MPLRLPARSMLAFAFAAGIAFAPTASSAPCAGFTDVDDTSLFCRNVEWMKNRGVTLGCTSVTAYCPNDPVIRLAMAAFLHRLGNAMTAVQLQRTGGAIGTIDLDAASVPSSCATGLVNSQYVVQSPRFAHGQAVLVAGPGTGTADIGLQIVESTDGGTTWDAVSPIHAASRIDNGQTSSPLSAMMGPRDLVVGTGYLYALRISRAAGSATTGDLEGAFQCFIRITLENRNPDSSPFDEDD